MASRILRIVLVVVVALILLAISSSWIMDWLWMRQVGYASIFWTLKLTQTGLLAGAFIVAAAYLIANFRKLAGHLKFVNFVGTPLEPLNIDLRRPEWLRRVKLFLTLAALAFALFFALSFLMRWDESLRFFWHVEVGKTDPIFGRDIGFYLFELPFWDLVQTSFSALVLLTLIALTVIYSIARLIQFDARRGVLAHPEVGRQLIWNAVIWLLLLAWGYYLDRYLLLTTQDGIVFGAGYTDVHVRLPALWVTIALVLLLAAILAVNRWFRRKHLVLVVTVLTIVVAIVGNALLPAFVQSFTVTPNELQLERPYLENNIELTRNAYGLADVEEIEYEAADTLTPADVEKNRDAVDNIRLWDPRLLIATYKQLQEIRSYYEFRSVDNDRYQVDGRLRQMMLSAREIAPQLPAQSNTWLNRHLQFTHGYGLAMSPVTETDPEGQPTLTVRDLPPVSDYPSLNVDQPAIYYGETSAGYYIVNSGTAELDYPNGDENVYTRYDGTGGIPFDNWFRKALFAWELGDGNILLSDYIKPDSRLQISRGIQERIRRITPFLGLDRDPYLVLSQGRLFWIQDAYTISSRYPYATRHGDINYIRNSVKIVVDAYHGTVEYYAVDQSDPVLKVYDAVFPGVFKPLAELPAGLATHLRYPQDLFEIQLEMYNRYHMTNPQVFYNAEDLWTRPNEKYGAQQQLMEPYYVLARLPNEQKLKFMLISPLTPKNRDNMIAWMAAESDPEDYGRLIVYKLPKKRLISGPAQIEARIDQNPEISQQISLWDQRGSHVIRGNLMVIPIEQSFLYVEPVFLLAEEVEIPQLQRVIVGVGNATAMEPTLDQALARVFGRVPVEERVPPTVASDTLVIGNRDLQRARELWQQLRSAMQAGNWQRYGEVMKELDDLIGE